MLTLLTVLLGLLVLGVWAGLPGALTGRALGDTDGSAAALPNPAAERQAMIKCIEETNKRLDRIITILESGKIKVVITEGSSVKAPANADSATKPDAN
jgi:hypothetical protein